MHEKNNITHMISMSMPRCCVPLTVTALPNQLKRLLCSLKYFKF